ncbi:tellurite resistance TerB family protein [Nitrincola alkalilacustris]|uniref:tellurite resistance TerB family protein n=1 Tax=Nitrincola alkalilacustris TaxID=1571224 RepID=UPI00124CA27A|nr:tellurite resistance TerB family protein [Nitrincola alkalilacustris]
MINAGKILEQFLGNTGNQNFGQGQSPLSGSASGQGLNIPGGNFTGGAVAGGLLGLLVGSKKARKMAGGLVGYGGAAAAGALAFKAYQNWQQGKQVTTAPIATQDDLAQVDPRFLPSADKADSGNFSLTLITSMIAAAHADGHIDAKEQSIIFDHVEKLSLDAESKAFVFDALRQPPSLESIASGIQGVEQASEVYLVSRLVADGDHPAERVYLQALAHRLNLPADLVAHLDHQITGE